MSACTQLCGNTSVNTEHEESAEDNFATTILLDQQ